MQDIIYNIIIVGAGPIGLVLAKELSKNNKASPEISYWDFN